MEGATTITELATIGGGCFWCVETIFQRVRGVISAKPGFTGGKIENPTYKQVYTGETGHVEVVQIEFDPAILSYEELIQVFLRTHDPTTLNRQGEDKGSQYRSAIFYHSEARRDIAKKVIEDITKEKLYENEIVTEVEPLTIFYPAEDYHKDYYNLNPDQEYCAMVIRPKLAKFMKLFQTKVKAAA